MKDAGGDRRLVKRAIRPWTRAQDDLVRRLSVKAAARATGRSVRAIYQRRSKLGVPNLRKLRRWSDAEIQIILRYRPLEAAKRLRHRPIHQIRNARFLLFHRKPATGAKRKK